VNGDRSLRPEQPAPLADVGKPSRLLQRGLDRLEAHAGNIVPISALWVPVMIWGPEWLSLVHGAPESSEALTAVWGDAESITMERQVEGSIFSMWREEGYSFDWDIESASGTLRLDVDDPEALKRYWCQSPYLRVIGPNARGISVGTVNDGEPVNEYRSSWFWAFDRSSACIVDECGTVTRLPGLGGSQSVAFAAYSLSDVVGRSTTPDGIRRAVRWRNGDISTLPSPFVETGVTGINSVGQIIGWGGDSDPSGYVSDDRYPGGDKWGLVWTGENQPEILPGVPRAINDAGQIVGTVFSSDGSGDRAFVWWRGHTTYMSVPEPYRWSWATSINERGDVAGSAITESDRMRSEVCYLGEEFDQYFIDKYGSLPTSPGPFPDRVPCIWLRSLL
jgi:hypothetical protein